MGAEPPPFAIAALMVAGSATILSGSVDWRAEPRPCVAQCGPSWTLQRVSSATVDPAAQRVASTHSSNGGSQDMLTSWLVTQITVDEAERTNPGVTDERAKTDAAIAKPFGFQNAQWEAMKAMMQPGDALWTFSSPPDFWAHLAGRAGIVLQRGDHTVAEIVTIMN